MGYVIWGHGGLNDTQDNMPWCALATDTTMQFYADLGQYLNQSGATSIKFPDDIPQPWPPIDSTGVVPNLHLEPFTDEELERFTSLNPAWGGHTLLLVGREIPVDEAVLCTGTPETCPTDPRMISGEQDGPSEHGDDCTGLLKRYAGADLHWLACTGVEASERATAPIDPDANPVLKEYLEYLRDDPDAFGTWFDALPPEDIEALLADPQITAWHRARIVRIARGDAPSHVILGEDPADPVPAMVLSDGRRVGDARLHLEQDAADFAEWFDSMSAADQSLCRQHPVIAQWDDDRRIAQQNAEAESAREGRPATEDEIDLAAVDVLNTRNLDRTADGETVFYAQAGNVVLIGEGHPWAVVQYVGGHASYASGEVTVKKGGTFSTGRLDVTNCIERDSFEAAIGRISKKSVRFG